MQGLRRAVLLGGCLLGGCLLASRIVGPAGVRTTMCVRLKSRLPACPLLVPTQVCRTSVCVSARACVCMYARVNLCAFGLQQQVEYHQERCNGSACPASRGLGSCGSVSLECRSIGTCAVGLPVRSLFVYSIHRTHNPQTHEASRLERTSA